MKFCLIVTPSLVIHDAVSNDVVKQCEYLRSLGIQAMIYAEHVDSAYAHLAIADKHVYDYILDPDRLLIYHHSIQWDHGTALVDLAKCQVIMKYHNITPPEFFKKYNPTIAEITKQGRLQTAAMIRSQKIRHYIGDSEFNLAELFLAGVAKEAGSVIAPFHLVEDFAKAQVNSSLQKSMAKNGKNVLFVGRVVPNKGHPHLIRALAQYVKRYDDQVMLTIAGTLPPPDEGYFQEVRNLILELGVERNVQFRTKVSFNDLHTLYSLADLFLVLSEHEGFCVPILEAQYHGLPVLALNRGAVKETLGSNQFVFDDINYEFIAAAMRRVFDDTELKKYLSENGRQNYQRFSHETICGQTRDLLERLHIC
jgi:glycosyltransferase involved in cell wall biosynthesis